MVSMSNSTIFTVYMYEDEKRYLEWLVLQREHIETGGDLFGLWRSSDTAVVQLVIGPGKHCMRTTTSFFQDINYLSEVGKELTSHQGLCNIGEWHSHHRIGLSRPSEGDQKTVWKHMKTVSGGRFLVFIASITGPTTNLNVSIGCFMFSTASRAMTQGSLVTLCGCSPIRRKFNDESLKPRPEVGMEWNSFRNASDDKRSLAKDTSYSGSPKDDNLKEALSHDKQRTRVKANPSAPRGIIRSEKGKDVLGKTNTVKTKLNTKTRSYGSTQINPKSEKEMNKPHNKNFKKHSTSPSSTNGNAITSQPQCMRDVASPTPETGNKSKQPSIFDCCNACRYKALNED